MNEHHGNYCFVERQQLGLLFEVGALKKAVVVNAPLDNGYHVMCIGNPTIYHLSGQRDDMQRLFKTADAAISSLRKIGFKTVEFQFS